MARVYEYPPQLLERMIQRGEAKEARSGITQAGSLDELTRSLNVLKP
jgi:hypothetical protein